MKLEARESVQRTTLIHRLNNSYSFLKGEHNHNFLGCGIIPSRASTGYSEEPV